MARGRYQHVMDAKGRISIPTSFRQELHAQDERPPILTVLLGSPALGLYSHEQWLDVERRLARMSQAKREVQRLQRLLVSGAVETPFDSQGRIVVPQHLRDHATLERDVTIAGVGARVELWDKTRFEGDLSEALEEADEIADVAAQLGL